MAGLERSLGDALALSTGDTDYQRKMAKAMRVRAERHDQALSALRGEHQAHLKQLEQKFANDLKTQQDNFDHELQRRNLEATAVLENALANKQRQNDLEKDHAVEQMRIEMEKLSQNRMVSIVSQHQESTQALIQNHKEELRKRLAQMAQQKDELHKGDMALALKENDIKWEKVLEQRLCEEQGELSKAQDAEVEAIKLECEKTIQDLTSQYMLERSRLGAEMLDQREETRVLAIKSEQSKIETKFKELEASHQLNCTKIREQFNSEMVKARLEWEEEKAAELKQQEFVHEQRVRSFELEMSKMKAEFETSNMGQLVMSGRITEKLQAELAGRSQIGFPSTKTTVLSISIALLGLMAVFAMFMVFEYRHWLFYAHSLDKRFT